MKLSIIVPVYNMASGDKLRYCMDSLVNQTIEDYEIIAVDDASTDDSLTILNEYANAYPKKVKVLHHNENKRQGGAKNTGMAQAFGEWIGFIDSDDWIARDYYEKLLKRADETGADVVGCDYHLVHEHTMKIGRVIQNNTAEQCGVITKEQRKKLILRPGSMVIKIYKRRVIVDNQLCFPEGIFYEDNCAAPLWWLYFEHFEKIDEPLYYYYQHQVSTVHHITEEKCNDRLKAALLFLEETKKRGFYQEYKNEIDFRFTELYYSITLFSYMQGAEKKRLSYVEKMKGTLLENVPDFEKNPYYQSMTGQEEKKWIAMQKKSNRRFFLEYSLVLAVRKWKKRAKGKA